MMKICIYGAGAIGGLIGVRLGLLGEVALSVVARGETLQALTREGWSLQTGEELANVQVRASDKPEKLGEQDVVFIALKATAIAGIVDAIQPLIGPDTIIIPAMNGLPFWFSSHVPALRGAVLERIDPGARLAHAIPSARVLGCVVHASAYCASPGRVVHKRGLELIVGEPAGGESARVRMLTDILVKAGFEARASANISFDVWYKLWGNMTMNPVSALTGAPCDRLLADPLVREFCSQAMNEAAEIGRAIGLDVGQSAEDRHAVTEKLGSFRTSMLEDVDAHRAIELDALVGGIYELGQRLAIATPAIAGLYGITRLFARERGLYPPV
jgi:2-dehydropantoate 2-reductase